jgi:hypothetical protein
MKEYTKYNNIIVNAATVQRMHAAEAGCAFDLHWAIPIIICTPPVEETLSHVGTPLEFPQIFM